MDSLFSLVLFGIALMIYFHVMYFMKTNDDDALVMMDFEYPQYHYNELLEKMERIGKIKLPVLCTNALFKGNDEKYSNIMNVFSNLNVHIPYNIGKEHVNAYISLRLDELEQNVVNVNDEAFELDINKTKKTIGLTLPQHHYLNSLVERTSGISENYLAKQKILYKNNYFYFSNNSLTSYIPLQYYKSALNVFYVVSGKCNVVVENWGSIAKDSIVEDYGCFRFQSKTNFFKEQEGLRKIIPLEQGDVLVVPNKWFVGFELFEQSVVLREETTTLISFISTIPDYLKYFFYRSTKVIENKISDETDSDDKNDGGNKDIEKVMEVDEQEYENENDIENDNDTSDFLDTLH